MAEMVEKYRKMLENGTYDNEWELMNAEGINIDDLYQDEEDDETKEEEEWAFGKM